jgi:hypothetical protein
MVRRLVGALLQYTQRQILAGLAHMNAFGSVSSINVKAPGADVLETVFLDYPGAKLQRPPVLKLKKVVVVRRRERPDTRAFDAATAGSAFFARCEVRTRHCAWSTTVYGGRCGSPACVRAYARMYARLRDLLTLTTSLTDLPTPTPTRHELTAQLTRSLVHYDPPPIHFHSPVSPRRLFGGT